MTPGDSVRVTIGGRMHDAEVLYTRGVSVRVRLADGREKTVPVDRVRAAKPITVTAGPVVVVGDPFPVTREQALAIGLTSPTFTKAAEPPREVGPTLVWTDEAHVADAVRLKAVPKPKPPWRSSAYMAHVRKQRCIITYQPAEEAHHHGPHAMGRKGPDWTCIPLTQHEHDEFHRHGTFPSMTRAETDAHAIKAQVRCMTAWCEARGLDYMTAVRDALARVVEGDD